MVQSKRARVRALLVVPVLIAGTLLASSAQASSVTTRHGGGFTLTRSSAGATVSVTADTAAAKAQKEAFLATTASVCDGTLPCLSLGPAVNTGRLHYVHPLYCPCYYVPVWSKTYRACYTYEARSVVVCMTGKMIYVPTYAACFDECHIEGLWGSHYCGTSGTGAFGWGLDQIGCSSSYLESNHASVSRNTVKMCFIKIATCDTNTYHVNGYPSGTITGPYNGQGSL